VFEWQQATADKLDGSNITVVNLNGSRIDRAQWSRN